MGRIQRTTSPQAALLPPSATNGPTRGSSRAPARSFSESASAPHGDAGRSRRLPSLSSALRNVAPGPIGDIARGVEALAGGGGGARTGEFDAMWEMQADSQAFQLEMLALQQSIQDENRRFTTLSNVMKAQHDTAKSAIANIRV